MVTIFDSNPFLPLLTSICVPDCYREKETQACLPAPLSCSDILIIAIIRFLVFGRILRTALGFGRVLAGAASTIAVITVIFRVVCIVYGTIVVSHFCNLL